MSHVDAAKLFHSIIAYETPLLAADTPLAGGSHRMRACMGLYVRSQQYIAHYAGSPCQRSILQKKNNLTE